MPSTLGVRLALGAALAGAAGPAQAGWRCTDTFGNTYRLDRAPHSTEFSCTADDEPDPATVAAPAPTPAALAPIGPVLFDPSPSSAARGGLVLAPAPRGALAVIDPSRRAAFDPLIEAAALATHQDADLLRAVVQVESRFDPDAVSARGAIGLMQVMPATAAELGLAEPGRALFQPESNLRIGALYLRRLFDQFAGSPELALAAYNAGIGAVVRSGFAVPPYPETQGYVHDVLAAWEALRSQR